MIRIQLTLLLFGAVLLPLPGCGYRLGVQAPPGVYRIAVPTFTNQTFPLRRDIETELTSALREEIQGRTALRLVPDGRSDMTVYGWVREFRERVLAEGGLDEENNPLDEKLESMVTIRINLRIEDYVNGTVREEEVVEVQPLSALRGEEIDDARRRAIGNLAEKILLKVEAW